MKKPKAISKNQFEPSPKQRHIIEVLQAPTSLAHITRLTTLPRSTAEYNVKKLVEEKIVISKIVGKRVLYYSVPYNKHTSVKLPSSPISIVGPITVYQGALALEKIWKEIVEMPRGSRLIGIQPWQSFAEGIKRGRSSEVRETSKKITDQQFVIDTIAHEGLVKSIFKQLPDKDAKKLAKVFLGRPEDIVKVDPSFLNEKAEMFIINNNLIFIDWFNEVGLKIENRNLVNLLKAVYEATKAYGVRYSMGKHIEKIIESTPPNKPR